jgi:outer membrane protein assembly factor BamB
MFHRDLTHAAFMSSGPPISPAIAWSAALSDTVEFSSPVIASDGTIYLGDQGKELWAFSAWGTPRWHYHTGGNLRYGSAAVSDDGTVYIGSADGWLSALAWEGQLKWISSTGGAIKTSPAIASDGTIYIGSDDRKLWAFYPTGLMKWSFATGDTIRSSPALGSDGTIFFGSNDGYLYALYPDGTLRWAGATGGPLRDCSPAIGQGGDVIFGSSDGFLYSIRPSGTPNWATYTGHQIRSTPAIGVTGKIYLGLDTKIACYHDNGDPAWEFDTGARVQSTPAVMMGADSVDVILCGSDNGNFYAVRNGALLWSVPIGTPVRSSPAIGPNGFAYVGALDGRLYSIGVLAPSGGISLPTAADIRLLVGPNPARVHESVSFRLLGQTRVGGAMTIYDPRGVVYELCRLEREATMWEGREDGRELRREFTYTDGRTVMQRPPPPAEGAIARMRIARVQRCDATVRFRTAGTPA